MHVVRIAAVLVLLFSSATEAINRQQLRKRQTSSFISYLNGTSTNTTEVQLHIATQSGERNDTAPLLYGWMFEDINHSGDGGIYGELIRNRAFQGSDVVLGASPDQFGSTILSAENPCIPFASVLTGWRPIGDAQLSLDLLHPLSTALPTVLQIDIPDNATGEVGFLNEGWWGIDVRPQAYNASFHFMPNGPRYNGTLSSINLSLRSNLTNDIWCTASVPISNSTATIQYTYFSQALQNTATAPNSNNTFAITFDGAEAAGQTFYFDLISLFGETYNHRPNGLRKDLVQNFKDLNPKFLRFPGGNNIEGYSVQRRWKWWETIGPLKNRPGRPGDWEYYNTDGLGLLEFLEWTEDTEVEPVLAVYSGFSLDVVGNPPYWHDNSWPYDQLQEVLQEALDELEYCMGDNTTKYGALRIQHGHPEPFAINYVEIGNEDWFSSTYDYRFPFLYNGLKTVYPNITYISTAWNENSAYNITIPPGAMWDTHHYEEPTYFLENFNYYDNWQESTNNTNVTVLLGEYSVYSIDTPSGVVNFTNPPNEHIAYPRLLSAIAESIYAIGAERNPNTVRMQSYAPSFQNFNWYNWTPNLLAFTANPDETVLSVSYYQQKLFAHYRGTQTLTVTNTMGDFNPLWWVATIDVSANAVYLKVVNSGNQTVPLAVNLEQAYTGVNGTIITNADPNAFNFRNNQTAVVPIALDLNGTMTGDEDFNWGVPAWSITVLQFDL